MGREALYIVFTFGFACCVPLHILFPGAGETGVVFLMAVRVQHTALALAAANQPGAAKKRFRLPIS